MPDLTCSDVQVGYAIGRCPTSETREVTFFVQNNSSVSIRFTLDAENDGAVDFTSGAISPGQDLEHAHVYPARSSVDAVIEVTAPDGTACTYPFSIEVGDCEPIPAEVVTPGDEPGEPEVLEPVDVPPDETVGYEYGGGGGLSTCDGLCALLTAAVALVLAAAALTLSANIVAAIGEMAVGSAIGINAASLSTAVGGPVMLILIFVMALVCDDPCKIPRCILNGMWAGTLAIAALGLFGPMALLVAAVIVALLIILIAAGEIAYRRRCGD